LEGRTQIKGASRSFSWQVSLLMVDKSNTIYIDDENVYCFTVEISSLLYTTGFLSNMPPRNYDTIFLIPFRSEYNATLYIYTPTNSRVAGASFSSAGARRFLVFFSVLCRQTATNDAAITTAANVTPPPFPSFLHHLSLQCLPKKEDSRQYFSKYF
jgi:hypothetical protein